MPRFVCRFAVGARDAAVSGIWRVWTARNKPDLFLAFERLSGEIKATVHCPRPGWSGERVLKFTKQASGEVANELRRSGRLPRISWQGATVAPGVTLEWRIVLPGAQLRAKPVPVGQK